jgi:riboflavin synthase
MFTGIITDIGRIRSVRQGGDTRLEIETSYAKEAIEIGASIACSGACLTVTEKGADWFAVEASAETLRRTTIGLWCEGTLVNLERALRIGDELGGHLVSGHVDAIGEVEEIIPEGNSLRVGLSLPSEFARFIAEKGSVTLDGVSLTVNSVSNSIFDVNIIAHTHAATTFGKCEAGAPVNVEIDMLARYVARLMDFKERP